MAKKKDNDKVVKLEDSEQTKKTFDAKDELSEQKNENKIKDKEFREFPYGDLHFQCFRCGHMEMIEEGVHQGIQIVLPTTDKHKWTIVCNRCQNKMEFFFTENAKKAKEEAEKEAKEKAEKQALEKAKNKKKKSKNVKKDKENERTEKDSEEEKSV
ncbi:MAG: hypothetical protein ACOCUI_00390 [bacterium]